MRDRKEIQDAVARQEEEPSLVTRAVRNLEERGRPGLAQRTAEKARPIAAHIDILEWVLEESDHANRSGPEGGDQPPGV